MRIAFRIDNLWDYGALLAYAIDHDVDVKCGNWNDTKKHSYAYFIGAGSRQLFKSEESILARAGFDVVKPIFRVKEDGTVSIYIQTNYDDIQS